MAFLSPNSESVQVQKKEQKRTAFFSVFPDLNVMDRKFPDVNGHKTIYILLPVKPSPVRPSSPDTN